MEYMEYIIIAVILWCIVSFAVIWSIYLDVNYVKKEVEILEKMVFKMDEYYTKEITNSSSPTSYEEKCNQYRKIFDDWDELSFKERLDRINNFRCGF